MGFFSSIGHAFSSLGHGISSVIHHTPIVGQALEGSYNLAKNTIDTGFKNANKVLDISKSSFSGAADATKAVATGVPKIITSATGATTAVTGAIAKEAPLILHDVTNVAGGVASGVQGIGKVGEFLPFLAAGVAAIYLLKK